MTTETGMMLIEVFTAKPDEPDFAIRLSELSIIRHAVPHIEAEAVAAERGRIRAAVEGLEPQVIGNTESYERGFDAAVAEVLRIIEGEAP